MICSCTFFVWFFYDFNPYRSVSCRAEIRRNFVMFLQFKLIWAAVLMLQYRRVCSTEVSQPGVSLMCTGGSTAPAINCTINLTLHDCMGDQFTWWDSEGNDICNGGDLNYECDWDNLTYVSLAITKATACGPYEVFIDTTCGTARSKIMHCGYGELLQLTLNFLRLHKNWLQSLFVRSNAGSEKRSSDHRAGRLSSGGRLSGDLHPPFSFGNFVYPAEGNESQSNPEKFKKRHDNQSPSRFSHLRCALCLRLFLSMFCVCDH